MDVEYYRAEEERRERERLEIEERERYGIEWVLYMNDMDWLLQTRGRSSSTVCEARYCGHKDSGATNMHFLTIIKYRFYRNSIVVID